MKLFKKIFLAFLALFLLSALLGYFYFDKKFSPEENYLKVKNESGKIGMFWPNKEKSVLLLPVHFEGDSSTYFMQFDTGAPSTIFYENAIKHIFQIQKVGNSAKCLFKIGKTEVKSDKFKIINFGNESDTSKTIGTLGADILDGRKTILNFRKNYVEFNVKKNPTRFKNLTQFSFKKRKIIIPATLNSKQEKFIFDSGASGYELLTNKENWEELKIPNAKTTVENGNSWGKVLKVYTAKSKNFIDFNTTKLPLNSVTYVEGYSKTQYYMMKFSPMTGMLGNRIFMNSELFIDCQNNKVQIQ